MGQKSGSARGVLTEMQKLVSRSCSVTYQNIELNVRAYLGTRTLQTDLRFCLVVKLT